MYQAHRVAWFITHGKWPSDMIDHINLLRSDNRLENLREATRSENFHNRFTQSNNTSGYKNVYYQKDKNLWIAEIKKDGKIYKKRSKSLEKAIQFAQEFRETHLGDFARHE